MGYGLSKELEKREATLAEKQQNYMMKFQQEGSAKEIQW